MTAQSQAVLADLLKYFHHGDFSVFERAVALAGVVSPADDPFRTADLMLAAQMAGLIDVTNSEGGRTWWVAFEGDISVSSATQKVIGVTKDWATCYASAIRTVIASRHGEPLVLGVHGSGEKPLHEVCDFGPAFLRRLPSVRDIERQVVREERVLMDGMDSHIELFSSEDIRWLPIAASDVPMKGLIRLRRGYGGWTYVVRVGSASSSLVITDPDWALPIARNILGWRTSLFAEVRGDVLKVARAFRLPGLVLRYLFANSSLVTVGPQLCFDGADSSAIEHFLAYLEGK